MSINRFWLSLAVGSISEILQFSTSYNIDNDPYGIFWICGFPSYSSFQGTAFTLPFKGMLHMSTCLEYAPCSSYAEYSL